MKTLSFNLLAISAAFFVTCASVMAAGAKPSIIQAACLKCHGGVSVNGDLDFTQGLTREQKTDAIAKVAAGEMPMNGPKLTPAQFLQFKRELAGAKNADTLSASNAAPPARLAAKTVSTTGNVPQGRLSVVSSTGSNDSEVPTARVRVVPIGPPKSAQPPIGRVAVVTASDEAKAVVAPPKRVAKVTPPKTDDVDKSLDKLSAVKDDSSKVSDVIKGLAGDWMAVSRQGDGELSTVELQLDDHGWAKLTIPGADGKPSTTTRKVELKDNQLELTSKSGTVSLGKLVSADSRQLVLERDSGQVTFVRP